jgi:hypothetical protein
LGRDGASGYFLRARGVFGRKIGEFKAKGWNRAEWKFVKHRIQNIARGTVRSNERG